MLDVHPPHETVHTWKDFFIHVATICVGLLIAVGLEQTVEWLHHKSEIRETRQLLKEERAQNVKSFHHNVLNTRYLRAELEGDLRVFQYLQQHPGTPPDKLPGIAFFGTTSTHFNQASWLSAKQANVLALMPQLEVEESRELYERLNQSDDRATASLDSVEKAGAYQFIQPDPSKLTRAQVDAEIPLIQDCLSLTFTRMFWLFSIAGSYPDFAPGPSTEELTEFHRTLSVHPEKDFPAAYAFLQRDFDKADALELADQPGILYAKEIAERGAAHTAEAYEQVHTKYPDFKPVENDLNTQGYKLLSLGDLPAAIRIFKLNVQLYPNSWNTYDSLGEAYATSGKKKLAIENYQHAHQLNPTAPSPIEALKKLQK